MTRDPVVPAVEAALGSAVVAWESVSGGDINAAREARVPLYQLYFLMVHLNLFGGSYVASVEHALARVCF